MLSRRALRALSWVPLTPSPSLIAPNTSLHQYPSCNRTSQSISAAFLNQRRSHPQTRPSSSSSKRWQNRQGRDRFAREAKVQGLKSRAAFKLLEINEKYKIFKKGQTVVDLGYAPGSWSQVAVDRTQPHGRILGIDIIPAQPPRGVSTIQGNFLSPRVQDEVKRFLQDPERGRPRGHVSPFSNSPYSSDPDEESDYESGQVEVEVEDGAMGYVELERRASHDEDTTGDEETRPRTKKERETAAGRTVDVVLSDMCGPWPQTDGFWKRSLSEPFYRMCNTTGIGFKDHAGSMDLCNSALGFACDTLRIGGSFVCKFYMGEEDSVLEGRLKRLFKVVHREKPESSRSESREAYFVALKRKEGIEKEDVMRGA